ncbi:MAG: DUF3300 domain-containing protein [Dissulfurispiraceae bacterium]
MLKQKISLVVIWFLVLLMAVPPELFAQEAGGKPLFRQEELDQMLAPIALYPDSLLTQMLMASTYPLEIVQADRWAERHKDLKGDALAKALEKQPWDPSVKSLVNFPQVLQMMSSKLEETQKLGDAFLAQQQDVMATIQQLRAKAAAAGNLKTNKEQVVKVEKEVIIIQSASPTVIYVPAYNPVVVYGVWAYPAYPPYPYYPPGYVAGAHFFTGVAVGVAWGYAWGNANWKGGNVNVNYNQNTNINTNINRQSYQGKGQAGQGTWQHDVKHRGGVSYRDEKTAEKFNRGARGEAAKSREAFRGRAETGRQDLSRGGADQFKGRQEAGQRGAAGQAKQNISGGTAGQARQNVSGGTANRGGAFSGIDRGSSAKNASSRGQSSRQSMAPSSASSGAGGGAAKAGGSAGRAAGGGRAGGGRK